MAQARNVGGNRVLALTEGWEIASIEVTAKGEGGLADPRELDARALAWVPAHVPGTAASALRAKGAWDFTTKRNFDASEWWLRGSFDCEAAAPGEAIVLRFDGLATVADVWLNGEPLFASDNMFAAHAIDVTSRVQAKNVIAIRFKALTGVLAQKRPRPRWRTRLVEQQQLRWIRTTLLGRVPGWTPPVACVGAWRGISLERRSTIAIDETNVTTRVDRNAGVAQVALRLRSIGKNAIAGASLHIGEHEAPLVLRPESDGQIVIDGELRIDDATLWWPHTHGAPHLYTARIALRMTDGATVDVDLGRVGFRTIRLDTTDGAFTINVNGVDVFCRGACWTTTDVVTLGGDAAAYAKAVGQARAAGMNMLRVGGTMVYEDDAFYDACDALGILVWQDFMFANMDYPGSDETFLASVKREVTQFLARTQASPSLAVLCGNSEIEQQVAMLGLPREQWTQPLFDDVLPAIGKRMRPDVPYVPSTPTGGTLPFQVSHGVSHYYGVGAYMRPLEDARRAEVRFTSECLGFSNVPEDSTIEKFMGDGESPFHHPNWKIRVPRDSGPGWDFEDVRDHYLKRLFGVDGASLRYADVTRYLALSRVVTGEVIANAIGEWRRRRSTCKGALVWFYRDLWPGAGWGLIDSLGVPKAAYYYARRAMQPRALLISDEGLNGLELHAVNDGPAAIDAELHLALYRNGDVRVGEGRAQVTVPGHGGAEVRGDSLFEHFVDTTYAYRFGPPAHDFAVATMTERTTGTRLGQAFHFPSGWPSSRADDVGLEASAEAREDGTYVLTARTKKLAQSVAIDVRGYLPDDDYFHVAPGGEITTILRPIAGTPKFGGTVQALNAHGPTKIALAAIK